MRSLSTSPVDLSAFFLRRTRRNLRLVMVTSSVSAPVFGRCSPDPSLPGDRSSTINFGGTGKVVAAVFCAGDDDVQTECLQARLSRTWWEIELKNTMLFGKGFSFILRRLSRARARNKH